MKITFQGKHGSIDKSVVWENVPQLAILTGRNGAGKTQLLEVIAYTYGALRQDARGQPIIREEDRVNRPKANIEGYTFERGEVFHAHSSWPTFGGGSASSQQIKESLRTIQTLGQEGKPLPWVINELARRVGVAPDAVRSLPLPRIEEVMTPTLLWGQGIPNGYQSIAFLFLAYRMFERTLSLSGIPDEQVREKIGTPPWDLLNEVLTGASLPFRVVEPEPTRKQSLLDAESYTLRLLDVERSEEVPFEKLSSGERVIMSTALWLFGVQETAQHYKLLLLDEPDAHLHPSMTRRFLDVIQKVFVEERGVRVIMSTHSPSTVAVVSEDSLFEMRRTVPRILKVTSKSDAVAELTDGFVVVHDGMRVVFCEGDNDPPFFSTVWDRITDRGGAAGALLPLVPSLVFVHGKGRDTIRPVVRQLRDFGLHHFFGLVDLDNGNKPEDGIFVTGRRELENYLYDPLNIWCVLHDEGEAPVVSGVNILRGQCSKVKHLQDGQLQAVADAILDAVRPHFTQVIEDAEARQLVEFVSKKNVLYPKWFLYGGAESLIAAFQTEYPLLRGKRPGKLITNFATLDLVPAELLETFRQIQSSRPRATRV
jgi:ABC-type Mn2+/Zn2+ transport system ATPase subunit